MAKLTALMLGALFFGMALLLLALIPFCLIAGFFCLVFGKEKTKLYGFNVYHALDNLGSAMLGGDSEETISSRLGKAREKGSKWGVVANALDLVALELFNNKDHCKRSIEREEGETQVTRY